MSFEFAQALWPFSQIGWLQALVYAAIIGAVAVFLARTVRRVILALGRRANRFPVDRTSLVFVAQLAQLGIYVGAAMIYAQLVPGLRSLGTALLAGVSIVSIVIGLAAQSTLSNFIAGFSLLLYRPFKVGDSLQITAPTGLETGVVHAVTLGYTVLQTFDRRRIVVPNSAIFNQVTVNLTAGGSRSLASVPFTVGYEADLDRTQAALIDLARKHPQVLEVLDCPVTELAAAGVTLTLRAWCADPRTAQEVRFGLLEDGLKLLERTGVPPFASRVGK